MILTAVNFFSFTLGIRSHLDVILPQRNHPPELPSPTPPYRTLYLLHGLSDDHTAWQRYTSIERYVEGLNLAVVMPAVQRSFYTDMAQGGKFWTYISEEVPAIARELFPLSTKREDNFAAGLSMGGYGAMKLALRHPDRYAAAASLSGALDICATARGEEPGWQDEMARIFGDRSQLQGSPDDLFALAEAVSRLKVRPRLYQWCGMDDFLYPDNLRFRDHVRPLGFDHTYAEGPGEHTWKYWDAQIQKVLEWFKFN
jgi:putative tributyrin esterase